MYELNVMKNRRLRAEKEAAERTDVIVAAAKYSLRTPELILESLQTTYPDKIPTVLHMDLARLQGQQDVIRELDGLIKTANGDT
jgi:hypothetical protein